MKNKTDQMQMALLRQWNLAKLENRMKSLAKSDSWFIDPIALLLSLKNKKYLQEKSVRNGKVRDVLLSQSLGQSQTVVEALLKRWPKRQRSV